MSKKIAVWSLCLVVFLGGCQYWTKTSTPVKKGILASKINGMAIMAPPSPFKINPMPALQDLGVNWISIQPFAFFYKNQPQIYYSGYQWWGEKKEGLVKTIKLAQAAKLKVLLKPQLWAYNQWIGDLSFEAEEDWDIFEREYRTYILPLAKLADSLGVQMLAVGTEVKLSALKRPHFWRQLIKEIRAVYSGKLVYAANWDNYTAVTFWDALDYIGIDAYFPLTPKQRPTVEELKKAWQPTNDSLKHFYNLWQRPILFTEFGYMSLEGCAYKAWLLEKSKKQAILSETAQANALQALLENFGEQDWWAGGFQWKWYADLPSVLNQDEAARDYTPQGKKAMGMLKDLYKGS